MVLTSDQPQAVDICEHYWAWVSPAGTSNSARICTLCHEPCPEWLNSIRSTMCDCESRHPGYACSGRSCPCHDPKETMTVPIKFEGFILGKAEISPDCMIITAELDESGAGQEIRNVLLCGLADSISIRPNFLPATKM